MIRVVGSTDFTRTVITVASATLAPRRWFSASSTSAPSSRDDDVERPKKWKKATKRAKNIIINLENEQVAKAKFGREHWPEFNPGDAIQVRYKVNMSRARVQQMRGIVLAKKNRGMGSSFLLHNIIAGSPFEIRFPLHSPLIEDIQMIQPNFVHKGSKRIKRAKLNYLREYLPSRITVKDTLEVMTAAQLQEARNKMKKKKQ